MVVVVCLFVCFWLLPCFSVGLTCKSEESSSSLHIKEEYKRQKDTCWWREALEWESACSAWGIITTLGWLDQWSSTGDATKHSIIQREHPSPQKITLPKMSVMPGLRKPWLKHVS